MLARTSIIAALFVATFAIPQTAQAQVRHRLGFTLGSNYSSIQSDLFTTSAGRLSAVVGCNFQFEFNDRFSVSQEIMFTRKGGSVKAVHFVPTIVQFRLTCLNASRIAFGRQAST